MGYHFVREQLLSDSAMRHHPLTPMTNPNLVDFLGWQTKRHVGLASYSVVEAGPDALARHFAGLQSQGAAIAIVDCLNDKHLETICTAVAGMRLITGSSAPGIKLPALWRRRGWIDDSGSGSYMIDANARGNACLFVAGSCSNATREQNQWLADRGVLTIRPDADELISCDESKVVEQARLELVAGRHCLITTSAAPAEVEALQFRAREQLITPAELGLRIVSLLADVTRKILEAHIPAALVVAGGETSGAICRQLELGALRVGEEHLNPGVPLCESLGKFVLPVVLKSGNFGSTDFYGRALKAAGCSIS